MAKNTGLRRIFNAFFFSCKGLQYAFRNEAAFRQESMVALVLIPTALLLNITVLEKLCLVAVLFLVLIIELINTAIEAVVDRIGSEHHVLAGAAKDAGSAAVLLCILLAVVVWLSILLF